MSTENAWNQYVAKFNTPPQNSTQLMRFSQRNTNCESLNFSSSQKIFNIHQNSIKLPAKKKSKAKQKKIYKSCKSKKTKQPKLPNHITSLNNVLNYTKHPQNSIPSTKENDSHSIIKNKKHHRRNHKHIQINNENVFKATTNQLSINLPPTKITCNTKPRFAISRRTTTNNQQENQYNVTVLHQRDNISNLLRKLPTPPPPPPPLLQSNTTIAEPGAARYSFPESTPLTNELKPKIPSLLHAKLKEVSVFLYVEFPVAISFDKCVWSDADIKIKQFPGLKSKTCLTGIENNLVGGFYEFNSRENAQNYIDNYLISVANKLGVEGTYKLFQKTNTNNVPFN